MVSHEDKRGSHLQDAVRLLFLLDRAGEPLEKEELPEAVCVVRAESRVQAVVFWMRNPDFLAHEVLRDIEDGVRPKSDLGVAAGLLDGDEPELRRYPMAMSQFSAYEPLDNAFAVLVAQRLADRGQQRLSAKKVRKNFYLLQAGRDVARDIVKQEPVLAWYDDRAVLVSEVAREQNGTVLKIRQRQHPEYAGTKPGTKIPAITSLVREHLDQMRASETLI